MRVWSSSYLSFQPRLENKGESELFLGVISRAMRVNLIHALSLHASLLCVCGLARKPSKSMFAPSGIPPVEIHARDFVELGNGGCSPTRSDIRMACLAHTSCPATIHRLKGQHASIDGADEGK
jgi:hypothetical protein